MKYSRFEHVWHRPYVGALLHPFSSARMFWGTDALELVWVAFCS